MKSKMLYSENDLAKYAINYVISWMHGSESSFDEWCENVDGMRNLKNLKYSQENKYTYDYLKYICEKYCDYSKLVGWDAIFDIWYINHLRYLKINKIIKIIKYNK